LADSERLQRSVLDVLDEGVVVVGLDGVLVQANPAACAILGLDRDAALADPAWWEAFGARNASDGSPLDAGATAMRTGKDVRDVAVEADRLDGTTMSLSLNYQPLRDEAGALSGLLLSFSDITAREREHRSLLESQERLREAHEVAQLSSWEWRPETGEVLVFHALADAPAEAGTTVTLESILAGMPADHRQVARDDLAAVVRGECDSTVQRHPYPAAQAWLETRTRAVRDADAGLLCVRGTSQDVTEQELAKREAAAERDFFQSTLDSLSAHIAVLGVHGEIVMTNHAWAEFAAANGPRRPNSEPTISRPATPRRATSSRHRRPPACAKSWRAPERTSRSSILPRPGHRALVHHARRALRGSRGRACRGRPRRCDPAPAGAAAGDHAGDAASGGRRGGGGDRCQGPRYVLEPWS
jgi:PAS domain S-box-containing protein